MPDDPMEDVTDLIRAYREKNKKDGSTIPNPGMEKTILDLMARINKEDRAKVIEWIYKNHPINWALDYLKVEEAIRAVGLAIYSNTQSIKWTCDACALVFNYLQGANYKDKHDHDMHPVCPRCGFSPADTMNARFIAERQKGEFPQGYEASKAEYLGNYQKRKANSRYSGWLFDRKEDDDFEEAKRREVIDKMKADAHREAYDQKLAEVTEARHAPEPARK